MDKRIRVLVVDDHPVVRLGICEALRFAEEVEIVGEADCGKIALSMVESLRPDVLILDARIPELDGLEVAKRVREQFPEIRILVLSAYAEDSYVFGMLEAGVQGYLLKDDAIEHVVEAVRQVAAGGLWFSPEIAAKVMGGDTSEKVELTPREEEILELMVDGLGNCEIAARLGISRRTVEFHVSNILHKLGVSSRIEAILWAKERGRVR